VGKMRDLILQLSKSSIYSTKPDSVHHIWCPLSSQEYQDLPDGAETTLTVNMQTVTVQWLISE
ncbi:TPA: hypothetical protein ACHJH4_005155, partial [Klebsiella quasipneumoniae]